MAINFAAALVADNVNSCVLNVLTIVGAPGAAATLDINQAAFAAAYPATTFVWTAAETLYFIMQGGADFRDIPGGGGTGFMEDTPVLIPLAGGITVAVEARAARGADVEICDLLLLRASSLG